jgi:hypothetical protein
MIELFDENVDFNIENLSIEEIMQLEKTFNLEKKIHPDLKMNEDEFFKLIENVENSEYNDMVVSFDDAFLE